jgi:hypothetical protein
MQQKTKLKTDSILTDEEWGEAGGEQCDRSDGGDEGPDSALFFS